MSMAGLRSAWFLVGHSLLFVYVVWMCFWNQNSRRHVFQKFVGSIKIQKLMT